MKRKVEVRRPVSRPKRKPVVAPVTMTIGTSEYAAIQDNIMTLMGQIDELKQKLVVDQEVKKPPRYVKIEDHTDQQLNDAINYAVTNCPGFWKILHGVDAYMERRRRQKAKPKSQMSNSLNWAPDWRR